MMVSRLWAKQGFSTALYNSSVDQIWRADWAEDLSWSTGVR